MTTQNPQIPTAFPKGLNKIYLNNNKEIQALFERMCELGELSSPDSVVVNINRELVGGIKRYLGFLSVYNETLSVRLGTPESDFTIGIQYLNSDIILKYISLEICNGEYFHLNNPDLVPGDIFRMRDFINNILCMLTIHAPYRDGSYLRYRDEASILLKLEAKPEGSLIKHYLDYDFSSIGRSITKVATQHNRDLDYITCLTEGIAHVASVVESLPYVMDSLIKISYYKQVNERIIGVTEIINSLCSAKHEATRKAAENNT